VICAAGEGPRAATLLLLQVPPRPTCSFCGFEKHHQTQGVPFYPFPPWLSLSPPLPFFGFFNEPHPPVFWRRAFLCFSFFSFFPRTWEEHFPPPSMSETVCPSFGSFFPGAGTPFAALGTSQKALSIRWKLPFFFLSPGKSILLSFLIWLLFL